ncbi:MAG TPA: hypothetical protein EYP41_07945, partial [Anaerolineae bacterium]|nr:hypothetical protein [Anaerolineae bacterium]
MSETTKQPDFTLAEAAALLRQRYGRSGTLTPLPGEYDQNFRLDTPDGRSCILKISPPDTPPELLAMQDEALTFIARRLPQACPQPIPPATSHQLPATDRRSRLLTWLPGTLYAHARPHTAVLQRSLGQFIGQLDKALAAFEHPAAHRRLQWDLSQAASVAGYTKCITGKEDRALAERFLDAFQRRVQPCLPHLRRQIIHNDANDYNVLTQNGRVTGIIDFGDMVHTAVIHELAIACAYAILDQPDPLLAAAQVIAGYHQAYPLLDEEVDLLYDLIATRLAVSVTLAAYRETAAPGNAYHQISARPAWAALRQLAAADPTHARTIFRHACGLRYTAINLPPHSTTPSAPHLTARRQHLGPSLSLAYDEPLQIVRGYRQYLYDENGRGQTAAVYIKQRLQMQSPRLLLQTVRPAFVRSGGNPESHTTPCAS